ncbi:uncharacterized protein LOC141598685 [Silene latifolia]|uniref:uncharacterized protein LOC141598685 n=1 Tax=Silene latifolia TaxID=37657 RepID=UPI003D76E643
MGVDYYNTLKVTKSTGEEELRKTYKKLAMTWHPDKHPSGAKELAEAKFKQICEAYDVLSDPTKRHMYDLYGEDALRYDDVSSPSSASSGDYVGDFFGGFGSDNSNDNDNKRDGYRNSPLKSKAEPIENNLGCTLEELYKGSKRKMAISRIVPDKFGKPSRMEEVLAIDIKPGWKRGTKITFQDKGHQEPGLLPGDLIFVVDERPHDIYKREGNDLIMTQKVSLVEALTGTTLKFTTLDGRNLTIDVYDVVKPGSEVVIPGEGMPISRDPRKKGNLRINFDVKFPSRLSPEKKAVLKRILT